MLRFEGLSNDVHLPTPFTLHTFLSHPPIFLLFHSCRVTSLHWLPPIPLIYHFLTLHLPRLLPPEIVLSCPFLSYRRSHLRLICHFITFPFPLHFLSCSTHFPAWASSLPSSLTVIFFITLPLPRFFFPIHTSCPSLPVGCPHPSIPTPHHPSAWTLIFLSYSQTYRICIYPSTIITISV